MENAVSRIPPNSLEAEQAILGSMMLSERCAAEVMSRNVREMDFYSGTHRRIWTAMTLVASSGSPIDLVTVTEQLERKEQLSLEQLTYLSDLPARVPATENISRYVDILKEKSTLRQLLDAAGRIADSVFAEDVTAQDALNNASQMIYSIAESGQERSLIKLKEALFESYAKIDDAIKSKDGILGISTGFTGKPAYHRGRPDGYGKDQLCPQHRGACRREKGAARCDLFLGNERRPVGDEADVRRGGGGFPESAQRHGDAGGHRQTGERPCAFGRERHLCG